MTLLTFLFFTALVGALTWLITRRDDHVTSDGYFLGGRSLTAGFIAGSLLLTNLSTEQLVGLNGAAFADGLSVMAWEVIAALSLVVMALFFLPRYLKQGIATVPELLERRFNDTTRLITTFIFIFAYAGILLPIVLYSGAKAMIEMLQLQELTGITSYPMMMWVTVWMIGGIGAIYAIFGGLRTVAVSDTLNGIGLLVGGLAITWFGLQAINPEGVLPALRTMYDAQPDRFNSLGSDTQSVPMSTLFTGVLLLNLFYWTTNQQIIQRTFGAKSLAEAQKGVMIAAFFKLLAPLIVVIPGMIAFHLYADTGVSKDDAYAMLVREQLPVWLTGFFAAVIAGAILSSFNSALNSTATLFSLGVFRHLFHPQATEEQTIRSGKWFGWIIAIASMSIAPLLIGQDSIFGYLQKMNGMYFIPILSVVVVALLTKRVPAIAANLALGLGLVAIVLGYFVPPFNGWAAQVNEFHFLGIVFASLVLMMLAIGVLAPKEVDETEVDTPSRVDPTPWRWVLPSGIALALMVLTLYVLLARPIAPAVSLPAAISP
ncbi:MAG: solute:sodium symporter family transporter [Planctomycetaceae bacterium]